MTLTAAFCLDIFTRYALVSTAFLQWKNLEQINHFDELNHWLQDEQHLLL